MLQTSISKNDIHGIEKSVYDWELRISCTAREKLFTVGMSPYIYEVLGGKYFDEDEPKKFTRVSLSHIFDETGLKIRIKKDVNGKQKLRKINHEELGLRINSKQDNPVSYPFKSFRMIANKVDEDKKQVEFFIPFSKMRKAKPKGQNGPTGLLFHKPEKKQGITGCTCMGCERVYKADLLVADSVWEQISPKEVEGNKGGGLLCPTCIMERIVDKGIWTVGFALDANTLPKLLSTSS